MEPMSPKAATINKAQCFEIVDQLEECMQIESVINLAIGGLGKLYGQDIPKLEQYLCRENFEFAVIQEFRDEQNKLREQQLEGQKRRLEATFNEVVMMFRGRLELATMLRLVGYLKHQPVRANLVKKERIPWLFIQHRQIFIEKAYSQAIAGTSEGKRFEALVKFVQEAFVEQVLLLYRAAFYDEDSALIFFSIRNCRNYIHEIEQIIDKCKDLSVLASYWNQLVVLDKTLEKEKMCFLPFLSDKFYQRVEGIACQLVNGPFERASHMVKQARPDDLKACSENRDATISSFAILRSLANSLIDLFSNLVQFAVPQLHARISAIILGMYEKLKNDVGMLGGSEEFKKVYHTEFKVFIEKALNDIYASSAIYATATN